MLHFKKSCRIDLKNEKSEHTSRFRGNFRKIFSTIFINESVVSLWDLPFNQLLQTWFLNEWKKRLAKIPYVTFFFRFDKDIFTGVPDAQIDDAVTRFKNYQSMLIIQLMLNKNQINFLDPTILRKEEVITNWFRKPTWSGRCLNFFSYSEIEYKVSVIHNMINKAVKESHNSFTNAIIQIVKNTVRIIDLMFLFINISRKDWILSNSLMLIIQILLHKVIAVLFVILKDIFYSY